MSHITDPIADLFARLKNGLSRQHKSITVPASSLKKSILDVLVAEGYLLGVTESANERGHKQFDIELKYYQGKPVITDITRISKPGRREYTQAANIPMVSNGLGVTLISTSKGVVSDTKARELNVGGEVLGQVF
jgi:small subunit ribosomal protein S8